MARIPQVQALTFDVFGTILDLDESLTPPLRRFLTGQGATVPAERFWEQWRARQRLEQFQDTLLMLGHSGYLETARRALMYTLRLHAVEASAEEVAAFMEVWRELSPFPDVIPALERLKSHYRLVVLSNGEPEFLDHLVRHRVQWEFDAVISVSPIGVFKPHPAVYRRAAGILGLEVGECLMVSSNSFDVVGARSCGMRGAYVDRYRLPYEETPYQPDVTVGDFAGLATALGQHV
ncbi:MAG: haloacid dehalogenase type II [Armatimonadota bacterium]